MFKKAICLILLVGLIVAPGCWRGTDDPGPETTLERFIDRWNQGEYLDMFALLSEDSREGLDLETFTSRYENISNGIGLTGLEMVEWDQEEDGFLSYTLEFSTTTVGYFRQDYRISVVQEDGKWRLVWGHEHIFPQLTKDRVVRVNRTLPRRGNILDRNGHPLAYHGSVYTIGLVPGRIDDDSAADLAQVLEISPDEIQRLLNQGWVRPDTYVPVQTVSQQRRDQLQDGLSEIAGVSVRQAQGRVYDIPESLAQTIGYIGEVSSGRLDELRPLGFRSGDMVGAFGLELEYDEKLLGSPGFSITIRDGNDIVSIIAETEVVHGQDLVTTIDLSKQLILDRVLGDRSGTVMLMDYTNGNILAVASRPGFDSNIFANGITSAQYRALEELDSPFVNRAFNGLYPPGSVFKPFTALMALEEGSLDPDYAWDTPLRWQPSSSWGSYHVTRVARPSGEVDLWEAMKWSDNVYFADIALGLGWQTFEMYSQELGLGQAPPVFFSHRLGKTRGNSVGEILLADTSYGQGEMLATPLHVSLMYAAIARGDGSMPVPRLTMGETEIWLQTGFSQENLKLMDQVLAYAASDQAARAWVGQDAIRGKTGTSEISETRQIAWYICYFDDYVMTVVLEGDRSISSSMAAAVARDALTFGIRD